MGSTHGHGTVTAYVVIGSFDGHDYEPFMPVFTREKAEAWAAHSQAREVKTAAERGRPGDHNTYRVEETQISRIDGYIRLVTGYTRTGRAQVREISRVIRHLNRLADGTIVGDAIISRGQTGAVSLAPGARYWRPVE